MMKADYKKYILHFKQPAGTSRGVYTERTSWFIFIFDTDNPAQIGIGECAPLPGLSPELNAGFTDKLADICKNIERYGDLTSTDLVEFPSIKMGLETAFLDYQNKGTKIFYRNAFAEGTRGIKINGLVWMGSPEFLDEQIRSKLNDRCTCIKLKVGAIDFDAELALIKKIRKKYGAPDVAIRVDANGAFSPAEAMDKLKALSALDVHSIEQPVKAGQQDFLARLCLGSHLPIALDEELIGINSLKQKQELIDYIHPQFLVLKPSLHGGFGGCSEWIKLAGVSNTGWWITSALESNIGLNAIAQWTSTLENNLHHGLGTGQLFTNNFDSPLYINNAELKFNANKTWDLSSLLND
jgi:L-alanine-DL-glutamate epimerase-like enolase superfamily enzyme